MDDTTLSMSRYTRFRELLNSTLTFDEYMRMTSVTITTRDNMDIDLTTLPDTINEIVISSHGPCTVVGGHNLTNLLSLTVVNGGEMTITISSRWNSLSTLILGDCTNVIIEDEGNYTLDTVQMAIADDIGILDNLNSAMSVTLKLLSPKDIDAISLPKAMEVSILSDSSIDSIMVELKSVRSLTLNVGGSLDMTRIVVGKGITSIDISCHTLLANPVMSESLRTLTISVTGYGMIDLGTVINIDTIYLSGLTIISDPIYNTLQCSRLHIEGNTRPINTLAVLGATKIKLRGGSYSMLVTGRSLRVLEIVVDKVRDLLLTDSESLESLIILADLSVLDLPEELNGLDRLLIRSPHRTDTVINGGNYINQDIASSFMRVANLSRYELPIDIVYNQR